MPLYTCTDRCRTCANGRMGHLTVEESKGRVRNSNSAGQAAHAPLVGQARAWRAASSRKLYQKRGDEDLGTVNWQRACIGADLRSPLGSLADLELDLSRARHHHCRCHCRCRCRCCCRCSRCHCRRCRCRRHVGEDALNRRAEIVIVSTLPIVSCRDPWFAVVKRP